MKKYFNLSRLISRIFSSLIFKTKRSVLEKSNQALSNQQENDVRSVGNKNLTSRSHYEPDGKLFIPGKGHFSPVRSFNHLQRIISKQNRLQFLEILQNHNIELNPEPEEEDVDFNDN